jgi:hypothetical protein
MIITESEDVKKAKEDPKKIVESFSGRKIDNYLETIRRFAKRLIEDQRLDQWLTDLRKVIEDCLTNPNTVDGENFYKRIDELVDRANELLQDIQERSDYQYILNETKSLFESIKNDPDVKNLQNSVDRFLKNFTYIDEKGNRRFNNDLVGQMRKFIVPLLMKQLENIPVPSLEGSTEDMDYKFENLVFNASDIIPDHVHISMASDMDFNVKELETEKVNTRALLKITNIKTRVPNLKFWFKRKTIPRIEDHGVADVSLTGDGANLSIYLELSSPFEEKSEFKFSKINFDIDKLKIDIKETQHTILMPILMTLLQGKFRRDIEQAIEDRIKSICKDIETGLNELLQKYPPSRLGSIITEELKSKDILPSLTTTKEKTNEPWRSETTSENQYMPSSSKQH